MTRAPDKNFRDMTDAELRAEHDHWDDKIRNATGWGGALAAADEFRRACRREAARRGLDVLRPEQPDKERQDV